MDLKSAFDTVWRDGLLYMLIKMKVSTKFIALISNMYSKVTGRVRTREGYTQDFPIHVGTKQGCNFSPSLFNCYINDLPEVLDNLNAHQPFLLGQKISYLLYANDLILLSKMPGGLQKLISTTEIFCNRWQLVINTHKTEIMVARKRNTQSFSWFIYGKEVEIVKSFCYLGIEFNSSGSFTQAIERLKSKANRAYIRLRQSFNFSNGTSVKVMIKLFDSIIQPILVYGSEIWAMFGWRKNHLACIRNFIMSKQHTFEKSHSEFCKETLGLDQQTPDIMAKAELGRIPIIAAIINRCYGYWQHLLNTNSQSFTHTALRANINFDRRGWDSYYSRIKSLWPLLK